MQSQCLAARVTVYLLETRSTEITVASDTKVAEAAALIRRHHIGALVIITDGGKPVGMLTDRDLVIEVVADLAVRERRYEAVTRS